MHLASPGSVTSRRVQKIALGGQASHSLAINKQVDQARLERQGITGRIVTSAHSATINDTIEVLAPSDPHRRRWER